MTKDEVNAELAKVEAEVHQMIANSHILQGAKLAFERVLAAIEAKEQAAVADIKVDITKDVTKDLKPNVAPPAASIG